ncbi:hypothetical protein F2Q70_00036278 [Brassica cretica]|uniref:Uncharacterized protein n=1 Tax=Brassica cretica TaxID=69181 RepID=A0A8S9JTD3_BRACR|nr:hypothetical protein F2Q70_00036278 [Brassica cretica]
MLDSVMKSGRIESGPSGLIFMSFSSFRLKYGYFFGKHGFDMVLVYNYLAICFGMIFIAFLIGWTDKVIIRSKDDYKIMRLNITFDLVWLCLAAHVYGGNGLFGGHLKFGLLLVLEVRKAVEALMSVVLCMLACWVEEPEGDYFKKHLARLHDFVWIGDDGLKFQVPCHQSHLS